MSTNSTIFTTRREVLTTSINTNKAVKFELFNDEGNIDRTATLDANRKYRDLFVTLKNALINAYGNEKPTNEVIEAFTKCINYYIDLNIEVIVTPTIFHLLLAKLTGNFARKDENGVAIAPNALILASDNTFRKAIEIFIHNYLNNTLESMLSESELLAHRKALARLEKVKAKKAEAKAKKTAEKTAEKPTPTKSKKASKSKKTA